MRYTGIIVFYFFFGILVFLLMLRLQKKGLDFDLNKNTFEYGFFISIIFWPILLIFGILPKYLKFKYFK